MNDKLGATGEFPEGKLNATDEGALRIAIGIESGKLRIDFGKPVAWVAMPKMNAIMFAEAIMRAATDLKE